jgi:flagellar hook assembly protein FlgD
VTGGPALPLDPARVALFQNRPNPFTSATALAYQLPAKQRVRVSVYNVAGQRVRSLFEGEQAAGAHKVSWDGRDNAGARVAAGVYFCALESDGGVISRKMILVK